MYSGIVEEIGIVERAGETPAGLELAIGCRTVLEETRIGDSISVDGVCLTVTTIWKDGFTANIQPVTARLTTLGDKRPGDRLNLERSVAAGGRLGGHYVQGHIDGAGIVTGKRPDGAALIVDIDAPPEQLRYIVERGFVAVDGVSLTVMARRPDGFSVSLVTHTQEHITLPHVPIGGRVNLEVDVIAKYVEQLVAPFAVAG
jgi:riboflavin synthase